MKVLLLLLFIVCCITASAVRLSRFDSTAVGERPRHLSLMQRINDFLNQPEQGHPERPLDVSVLAGPRLSSTSGLGIGLMGSGLYSTHRADTLHPRSVMTLFSTITLRGLIEVGVRGHHFFSDPRYRIDYEGNFYTFKNKFWGLGFKEADQDSNQTYYRRRQAHVKAVLLRRFGRHYYAGFGFDYRWQSASHPDSLASTLLRGLPLSAGRLQAGLVAAYDTRDHLLNATRGWLVKVEQFFCPPVFRNVPFFGTTDFNVRHYRPVWDGGVIAGEVHSLIHYGQLPWTCLSEVGDNFRMRGYYEGRYRDRNLVEGQVELRQHVWGKYGVALWVAAANAFREARDCQLRHTLLNAGTGYRFNLREGMRIRFDLGWTRNGFGFLFQLNEAF